MWRQTAKTGFFKNEDKGEGEAKAEAEGGERGWGRERKKENQVMKEQKFTLKNVEIACEVVKDRKKAGKTDNNLEWKYNLDEKTQAYKKFDSKRERETLSFFGLDLPFSPSSSG